MGGLMFGDSEFHPAEAHTLGKPHANEQRADGEEFIDRATPHAGAGKVN